MRFSLFRTLACFVGGLWASGADEGELNPGSTGDFDLQLRKCDGIPVVRNTIFRPEGIRLHRIACFKLRECPI